MIIVKLSQDEIAVLVKCVENQFDRELCAFQYEQTRDVSFQQLKNVKDKLNGRVQS